MLRQDETTVRNDATTTAKAGAVGNAFCRGKIGRSAVGQIDQGPLKRLTTTRRRDASCTMSVGPVFTGSFGPRRPDAMRPDPRDRTGVRSVKIVFEKFFSRPVREFRPVTTKATLRDSEPAALRNAPVYCKTNGSKKWCIVAPLYST